MSELPAGDTHNVIRHGGQVVAVVVPIEEYRQLRLAMQEQQVNEEFDAAQVGYAARVRPGRSATCRMRKRVFYTIDEERRAIQVDQVARRP
jgi:precorrin-6B methylase 2